MEITCDLVPSQSLTVDSLRILPVTSTPCLLASNPLPPSPDTYPLLNPHHPDSSILIHRRIWRRLNCTQVDTSRANFHRRQCSLFLFILWSEPEKNDPLPRRVGQKYSQTISHGPTSLHCKENPICVFLFWKLRGLSLNFHIPVSVSYLYFPSIGPHISCRRIGRSIGRGNI